MLGKEVEILPRPHKSKPLFAVTWAFPNSYEVGMSSLGYQLVWWLMESNPEVKVSRAFTDCAEMGWDESELIGFTLSWELDYVNILRFLQKSRVANIASDRQDNQPLVFGGGPVLSANPEPFAEFFDVILLGDAEVSVPKLLDAWIKVRAIAGRKQQLLALAQIDGFYIPSLYQYKLTANEGPIACIEPICVDAPQKIIKQAFAPPPSYVAHSLLLAPDTTFGDMFLIEIARSCPQECRFCLASYLSRPFRAANIDSIVEKIDLGLKHTSKIGLLGPSVTEHPEFDRRADALIARPHTQISIASIRADTINQLVLEMLVKLGQKSVTIALESGSERLRAIMKKNLTEEQITSAVDLIAASGLKGLKFYGVVGLPGEKQDDLDETIKLITKLKKKHKHLRIVLGLSSFVPKAQTPFQWSGRDPKSQEKLQYIDKRLSKLGIQVRPESHNWSDIQALLSRGDRRLTPLLEKVALGNANIGSWHNALRHLPDGCPSEKYYVYRTIPYEETLPWSHLIDAPKQGMLIRHSHNAEQLAASTAKTVHETTKGHL